MKRGVLKELYITDECRKHMAIKVLSEKEISQIEFGMRKYSSEIVKMMVILDGSVEGNWRPFCKSAMRDLDISESRAIKLLAIKCLEVNRSISLNPRPVGHCISIWK